MTNLGSAADTNWGSDEEIDLAQLRQRRDRAEESTRGIDQILGGPVGFARTVLEHMEGEAESPQSSV